MAAPKAFVDAVDRYVRDIRTVRAGPPAHPETSLYPPLQTFLDTVLPLLPGSLAATQQPSTAVGAPDFVLRRGIESIGFVECKAPLKNVDNLHGEDRKQFDRYLLLDNWTITNYRIFVLYQDGVEIDRADIGSALILAPTSRTTPSASGSEDLWRLLNRTSTHSGQMLRSASTATTELARATRLVRLAVEAHLEAQHGKKSSTPLLSLLAEYRKLLIAELSESGFADAYAQTLAFGLLIARYMSGASVDPRTAHIAIGGVAHDLIGSALQLGAHPATLASIGWTTEVLTRIVNRIDTKAALARVKGAPDPLLYFYEDFLKTYDPSLRRARGAYYTPPEVVLYQVRAVEEALKSLGIQDTYLNASVNVLDPACGTGTYPLRLIERTEQLATAAGGPGTVGAAIDGLLSRMFGFEYLIGPYTVAHLRLAAAAASRGATQPPKVEVYLTNTLQQPGAPVHPTFAFMSQPLADEHNEADRVKSSVPILVVIGNPPYGRTKRDTGTWIDKLMDEYRSDVDPVEAKSLEENYARFIRWACWKLGDHGDQPAVLSFITNKSYLTGPAFAGLRRQLRFDFEQVDVLNLNGNLTRALVPGDENVFEVMVGVAIVVAVRRGKPQTAAAVRYDSWTGTAKSKLARLEATDPASIPWKPVIRPGITDPLVPIGSGVYEDWPRIDDCFTSKFSGVETNRDPLAIGATLSILRSKIAALYATFPGSDERKEVFKENRDRTIADITGTAFDAKYVRKVAFRPFDIEYLYDDPAFVNWPRPELREMWSDGNVALATVYPIVSGPSAIAVGELPDRHIYLDGAAIYPLWDKRPMSTMFSGSNLRDELLDLLKTSYGRVVSPQDAFYFIAAVLNAPAFSESYKETLEYERPRVPFPTAAATLDRGAKLGKRIVDNQAFGTPYPGGPALQFITGAGTVGDITYDGASILTIGSSAKVSGVLPAEADFTISRYRVIDKWLAERRGANLDYALQGEVLKLVWSIREAIRLGAEADVLLKDVIAGGTINGTSIARSTVHKVLFGGRRPIKSSKPKKPSRAKASSK